MSDFSSETSSLSRLIHIEEDDYGDNKIMVFVSIGWFSLGRIHNMGGGDENGGWTVCVEGTERGKALAKKVARKDIAIAMLIDWYRKEA